MRTEELVTILAGDVVLLDPNMGDAIIAPRVELIEAVTLIESTAKNPHNSPSWPQSSSAWDRIMIKLTDMAIFFPVVEYRL